MAKRKRKPADRPKFDPFKYEPKRPEPAFPPLSKLPAAEPAAETKRPEPAFSPLPELPAERELTPVEQRWLEFEAADYEGQIALCHQTIEEATLMDDEMAFEMFNTIYDQTVEHNERHRFEELAQKLRERLPEVFAQEAHYILDWQITNALATGQEAAVLPLARELAPTAGQHLDPFVRTLDQLDYHGQLPVLREIMPLAWPEVKEAAQVFDWAIDEFANRAADYVIFDQLERKPALEPDDPELQEKLGFYLEEINQEFLIKFLDSLTGRARRPWRMSDFDFERPPQTDKKNKKPAKTAKLSDEARQNLHDLTVEFLGYLRQAEGVPYTKGRLARRQIYNYLLDRHAGELVPQESMLETMQRGNRPKPKPKLSYPDHWLCPDRQTLDLFLARLVGFLSGRFYESVVTFELTPAWLRFLESRGLIEAEQRLKTLQDLRGLDTDMLKVFQDNPDPALPRAIEQWRERAGGS